MRSLRLLALIVVSSLASHSQSLPCSTIRQIPQLLEAAYSPSHQPAEILTVGSLREISFAPIAIKAGDGIYLEYKGSDFTIYAHYADRRMGAFDATSASTDGQWHNDTFLIEKPGVLKGLS